MGNDHEVATKGRGINGKEGVNNERTRASPNELDRSNEKRYHE